MTAIVTAFMLVHPGRPAVAAPVGLELSVKGEDFIGLIDRLAQGIRYIVEAFKSTKKEHLRKALPLMIHDLNILAALKEGLAVRLLTYADSEVPEKHLERKGNEISRTGEQILLSTMEIRDATRDLDPDWYAKNPELDARFQSIMELKGGLLREHVGTGVTLSPAAAKDFAELLQKEAEKLRSLARELALSLSKDFK